jgi:ribosome-associated toxin RatA of RatAB toxin-antitoxin module
MKRIARSALVEHAARELYALVEDIESYPRFLPWCREARVRERSGERTVATLSVGLKGMRYEFSTENRNRPPEAIDMRLLEGPFRRFEAHWRFHALGPRAARIEFAMAYELAGGVLARALAPLLDSIADSMVDAFTRRADQVHAKPAR